jgi:hypothetical protein
MRKALKKRDDAVFAECIRSRSPSQVSWRPRPMILKAHFTPNGGHTRRFAVMAFTTMTLPQLRDRIARVIQGSNSKKGEKPQQLFLRVQVIHYDTHTRRLNTLFCYNAIVYYV